MRFLFAPHGSAGFMLLDFLDLLPDPPQSLFSNFHSEKNIEDCVEKQWEDLVSADLPQKNAVQKNVVFPTRVLHVQSSGAHVQKRGVLFGMT